MPAANLLRELKQLNLRRARVSLVIVKEYKTNRVSNYILKYVQTDDGLKTKLRNIVLAKITAANSVEPYAVDSPEPEEDQVCSIGYEETDFLHIYEQLGQLNPEEDTIENVEELANAKAYMIVIRNSAGDEVIGFKKIPESWKLKRDRGIISLLFRGNQFEDLEDDNVFSISNTIEMFYYQETLFILSLKAFEQALNFREGIMSKAEDLYEEVEQLDLFVNLDILRRRVGNNQRYLRKIAVVANLRHYQNPQFLQGMAQLNAAKGWNIPFENGRIMFTEESIDTILTVLQNKRLHSELTDEDFDVPSAKLLNQP